MLEVFGRNWLLVLIRGVAALLFGAYIILGHPIIGLRTWILLFSLFAIVKGSFVWVTSFMTHRHHPNWFEFVINGPLRVAVGIITLAWPHLDASTLLQIIGSWEILRGVVHIVAGMQLRKLLRGAWLLHAAGVLSIAFGVLLLTLVDEQLIEIVTWIGACLAFFGIVWIAFAFVLRNWLNENRASLEPATS